MQWYRRDPAFLWVRVDRRRESPTLAFRNLADEVEHWLQAPREDFDRAISRQLEDRDAIVKGSKGKIQPVAESTTSVGLTALGESINISLHLISALSLEPGLRRKEDVKSTKMKRYTMEIDSGSEAYREIIGRADRCSERLSRECPEVVQSYKASLNHPVESRGGSHEEQDG